MAAIYSNPFLDGVVVLGNDGEALCHVSILLFDFFLHKRDLCRQVRDSINPLVEDASSVLLLLWLHHTAPPVVEIDGEVVSGHDC